MNPNDTIRLLILNDSREEAERLISMLLNAGRPTRAQHVDSEEGLAKLLQEQVWDLLIGHVATENVSPINAIKQIKRLNKDVPVILQTDDEGTLPIVEGIKAGACDVVRLDEDQHLLLVIQRELENREQRQQRRKSDRSCKEAERRGQQLLDSSRDAIAYVQDGMYLYVNDSFAERFGYDDKDDIECMPVIDMIADADQDKAKTFLKEFTLKGDDAESTNLEFGGIHRGEHQIPITVEVANAIYDEEPCIQFMIHASQGNNEELEAQINQIKHHDVVTGLYNRQFMLDSLEATVSDAANNELTSALLYIEIDNFLSQVQTNLGMAGSDKVLSDLATLLNANCDEQDTLARFGDETYMLIARGTGADLALQRAEDLCRKVEDHIIDIDGKTIQTSISIGIALINETSTDSETVIDHAIRAAESVHEGAETQGVGNGARLYEPPHDEDSDENRYQNVLNSVQRALDNNRFRLLFQPIISLRGSDEEHYEVLLRMLDENNDDIAPGAFLDVASKMGAISKIDRWVILEAIKVLSQHRNKGNQTKLIVNLSRHSLCDETLLPWLSVAFKAAELPTDALLFQVNEADVTNHMTAAKAFASGLQEIQCKMSISNFGCALNPFNTLKHINADYVKVHGSFTMDIQNENESPETLTNLVKQLHELNKTTVVPFVENASVLSALWQAGVHYIQGHYLQAPTAAMDYDFNMDE